MIKLKKIVDIFTINDIEISKNFILKNNIKFLAYGGGSYMDKNKPWVIAFIDDKIEKRYSDNEFEIMFNKFIK